jgi:hypothetical protein
MTFRIELLFRHHPLRLPSRFLNVEFDGGSSPRLPGIHNLGQTPNGGAIVRLVCGDFCGLDQGTPTLLLCPHELLRSIRIIVEHSQSGIFDSGLEFG